MSVIIVSTVTFTAVVPPVPLPIAIKRLTALMSLESVTMLLEKTRSMATMLRNRIVLREMKISAKRKPSFVADELKQDKITYKHAVEALSMWWCGFLLR